MERRIIFKCKVGSHLYGLNRPDSDIDYFSVFIPTSKDLLGLNKVEIVDNSTKSSSESRRNTEDDIDDKSYSLPRYLHLLLQNNPNIVETLFATPNNIEILEPEFKFLMDNYDKIISARVAHTFSGYAFAQKKKLITKKERYDSLKKALTYLENIIMNEDIDYEELYTTDNKFIRNISEDESIQLNKLLHYYKGEKQNCESFHVGMDIGMIYCKIRSEYEKYGWRVKTESFETLGYDIKFGYHLIRLMAEGIELLNTGKLSFPISGIAKSNIQYIRNGKISYNELLNMFKDYDDVFKCEVERSILRPKPDFNWANDWLIDTLKNHIIKEDRNFNINIIKNKAIKNVVKKAKKFSFNPEKNIKK